MANTQSNNMTKQKTQSSGISNIPKLLKYPKLLDYDHHKQQIKDKFVYIMPHYGYDGLSVLIYRQPKNDNIIIICGDWHGNQLDLVDNMNSDPIVKLASDFLIKDAMEFYKLLKLIKIEQVQLFFALQNNNLILVDMQISLNKFASPGMLKDIFGKLCRIPEMRTETMDDRMFEIIEKSGGSYDGNLIIKPNKFRLYEKDNKYCPMYLEVVR